MADFIHLLLVDDEPEFVDLAATRLRRADEQFEIHTATSVRDGLSVLAERDVDCIVSDYEMADLDGLAFLEVVRAEHPELPFILYTGVGSEEIASEAIAAGVTDYMQKSVGANQYQLLARRIRNAVAKHRAREQARNAQERAELVLDASPDAVLVTADAEIVYANPAAVDLFDATADEDLLGGTLSSVLAPDAIETASTETVAGWTDGTAETLAGAEMSVRVIVRPITWVGQDSTITIVRDRTEHEALLTELAEERAFIDQTLDALEDVCYVSSPDGEPVRWNRRMPEITGYSEDEIARMHVTDFFRADHQDRVAEAFKQAQTTGRTTVEADLQTATGERIPHEFTVVRLTDTAGDVVGCVGVGRDITVRREGQRELEQANTLLSTLFETLPVGVTILDTDGQITRANRRAEEVLGVSKSDITDRMYDDPEWHIVDEEGQPVSDEELPFAQVMATGEPVFDYQHGIRWPDGTERWLSISAAPLESSPSDVERVVAVILDVTDQREYEQTIEQQNEQLEQFTSIVSHDLRNPLSVAEGQLELARRDCDSEHLEAVDEAHKRMLALIDDLLTLAREGDAIAATEPVALSDLLGACWQAVQTDDATLRSETQLTLLADRGRLQQLLENLLRNAVEHGGDDVTVTVGDLSEDGFYVEDDGPGIPSEDRQQVFEAGYSTAGDGTGFGLNIVERVADAHGWELRATSGTDGGARFEITGVDTER